MVKYSRLKILENLREQINNNHSILAFGAGTGLTAKCAEKGGADLICVYSTAKYRMMGLPSLLAWLPYSDCNNLLYDMGREILPVVKTTPCIAGIGAHNPNLDLERFIKEIVNMGFVGITNEPFVGMYGENFASLLEKAGLGFSREVELISTARQMDILTMGWVFSAEEAYEMTKAGADIIGAMIGVTGGGLSGPEEVVSVETAVKEISKMTKAAKEASPDIIVLTHGGPLNDVETAKLSIQQTGADGYVSGSSGERIPTEQAIIKLTKKYKEINLQI